MRIREWLFVAPLMVLTAGALSIACGGSSDDLAPADLTDVVTATAPNPLPEPLIVGEVSPVPEGFSYTVQANDSPSSIATQFGVTAEAIMAANGIVDPTALVVGQVLIIPGGDGEPVEDVLGTTVEPTSTPESTPEATPDVDPGEQTVYIVQEGDIPETIAAQFGITAEELMAANGITDPTSLEIGQELIIPNPAATPTPEPEA